MEGNLPFRRASSIHLLMYECRSFAWVVQKIVGIAETTQEKRPPAEGMSGMQTTFRLAQKVGKSMG